MPDDPKFVIGDTAYKVPTSFGLTDPILVEEVTGLEFEDFSRRLDEVNASVGTDEPHSDYKVTLGLVACAVWQKNRTWSRDRVRRFLENVDVSTLNVQVPEAPADPPSPSPTEETLSPPGSQTAGSGTSDGSTTTPAALPEGVPV